MGGTGPGATTFSYGHDASARLTSIAINQPAFEWLPTLAYARSYGTANALNQISSAGGAAVGWDTDGNMTSDGVNTYSWTYGNRMSGASRAGMTATYDYDADDRRTKKTVDGVVTRTLWSGADELAELDAAGNVLRRFVPDGTGAMDARLATVENTGEVFWLHVDHQGSVIATSDSTGQTVGVAAYSPFGEFGDGQSAPPQHSPFGYTGRQFDPETGLYQYRARYYSPKLGQFLSTDPIGTQDDPNLYMYVGLDPVNATDPTGEQIWSDLLRNAPADILIGLGETANSMRRVVMEVYSEYPADRPTARDYTNVALAVASAVVPEAAAGRLSAGSSVARVGGGAAAAEGGVATTTVGRWMSRAEFDMMSQTGRVVEGAGGRTSVTRPPNPTSYTSARPGSVFAEFDVPTSSLRQGGKSDWSIIPGPNITTRMFGPPPAEMPPATCIRCTIGGQ